MCCIAAAAAAALLLYSVSFLSNLLLSRSFHLTHIHAYILLCCVGRHIVMHIRYTDTFVCRTQHILLCCNVPSDAVSINCEGKSKRMNTTLTYRTQTRWIHWNIIGLEDGKGLSSVDFRGSRFSYRTNRLQFLLLMKFYVCTDDDDDDGGCCIYGLTMIRFSFYFSSFHVQHQSISLFVHLSMCMIACNVFGFILWLVMLDWEWKR